MGVPSSPGQAAQRTASHSIGFYFGAQLMTPVACLVIAWGLVAGFVLSGAFGRLSVLSTLTAGQRTLTGAAVLVGTGLAVAVVTAILMGRLARRLSRETGALAATAQFLADQHLAQVVAALRDAGRAEQPDGAGRGTALTAETPPAPETSVAEVSAAAAAVAAMHRSAVAAAEAEAGLRTGFRQILVSLGRRNQSLLHRQLRIIDTLEQQASSPAALAELFTLDHLTTRMRRHAESLTILSGAAPGRSWSRPVAVVDVMRAAAAEVEDYTRVTVICDSDEAVAAPAVTDMIHLLAELIENATLFSPSATRVDVRAERVSNGFAVEVEDRGLGIPPDELRQLNAQLADPPDFDQADADRLGLFVVGRLAARHGVHVSLGPSQYRGTKAVVVFPDSIVVASGDEKKDYPERTQGDSARLNLRAPQVLSLAGAVPGPSAASEFGAPAATRALAEPAAENALPATSSGITRHGLPRRVRPETAGRHRADQGSAAVQPDRTVPGHQPVAAPAPEAARSLAASLQDSWQRSRQADSTDDTSDSEKGA